MKYRMIIADNTVTLSEEVNKALNDGWSLYYSHRVVTFPVDDAGGGHTAFEYSQAMIKYEDEGDFGLFDFNDLKQTHENALDRGLQ